MSPYNPALLGTRQCEHGPDMCGPVCQANDGTRLFNVTCLVCPLQISGHVDGVPFYFRARHDRWRLEVGKQEPGGLQIASGDTDDFTVAQAVALIEETMTHWIWQA